MAPAAVTAAGTERELSLKPRGRSNRRKDRGERRYSGLAVIPPTDRPGGIRRLQCSMNKWVKHRLTAA
jgi:hypothetical protein